ESEYAQMQRTALFAQSANGSINAGSESEIGSGDAAFGVFLQLRAVVNRPMHEHALGRDAIVVGFVVSHVHHAVEIAHGADETAISRFGGVPEVAREGDRRQRQRSPDPEGARFSGSAVP